MDNDRNEARDAGVLVFGRAVAMVAEAAMPFVIARLLGKADVGAFTGLMLVQTTLSTVLTAGFPAAMLYFLANRGAPARAAIANRLLSTTMVLGAVVGAVLWVVGSYGDAALLQFGAWVSGDDSGAPAELGALRYMVLYPVFDVLARVFPNYLIAVDRARGAAMFGVLRAVGLTAGTLIPAALGLGVTGIVLGLTLYALVQAVAIGLTLRSHQRGVPRVPAEVSTTTMLRFSYPLGLTDVVNNLNRAVDTTTVLVLFSAETLANYRFGAWQIPVATIAYSIGHVYMPRFVTLLEAGKGAEVIVLWRAAVHKASLIVVPVCMVFVVGAEDFMRVAFTDEYAGAAPVFRAYSIYTMGRVASFGAVILAAGRSGLLLRAAVFSLISNLVLTVPLAFALGFVGPAVGTALAFIPTVAVYCVYIARSLQIRVVETFPLWRWLSVVAVAGVSAVPALVLGPVLGLPPLFALIVDAVTIVPGFVLIARLAGVMSADDLRFARGWLRLDFLRRSEGGS